jgi:esterase/lipase superfamily enzyme
VLLFIHGFNTGYEHSLYRLTQIAHDFEIPAAPVLFAWPVDDSILSYIHDRDSADYSRRALAALLENLIAHGAHVQIVAHSMGAPLLMETLADLNLRHSSIPRRLDGIALVSPDMDVDLFVQRAEELGRLPQPFTVYTVPGQTAFRLMTAFLTDGEPRLGGRVDPDRLSNLELTYVDITSVSHGGILDVHFGLATSPDLIKAVNAMRQPDLARFPAIAGTLPGVEIEQIGRTTWIKLPESLLSGL